MFFVVYPSVFSDDVVSNEMYSYVCSVGVDHCLMESAQADWSVVELESCWMPAEAGSQPLTFAAAPFLFVVLTRSICSNCYCIVEFVFPPLTSIRARPVALLSDAVSLEGGAAPAAPG